MGSQEDGSTGDTGDTGDAVVLERRGGALHVVLDREERRNSLTPAQTTDLAARLEEAAAAEDLRVLVLRGAGSHFCAGADISAAGARRSRDARTGRVHRGVDRGAHRLLTLLQHVEIPIVAGVRGHAAGFGCGLALSADYVVAARSARFSTPFVRRGFTPDSGTTYLLPRLVGVARAKEMLLLGRPVDGEQAADWGLVNEVVDDEELEARLEEVAGELEGAATVAVGLARTLIHRNLHTGYEQALDAETHDVEIAVRSPDFREGIAAFAERRDPRFEGR